MQVVMLGSGVIGVTAAYFLAKEGHSVTVLDRQPAPALETSFGNAGELSYGYSSPWAGPGVPLKAISWLTMKHAPLVIRPRLDMAMMRWLWSTLRNCTQGRYAINKSRMVRIADYSRDCLRDLRAETGIEYDGRSLGTLQLFRTKKQIDAAARDIEVLRQYGVAYELLDVDGCVRAEPALARVRDRFLGGLRLPEDETGDCHMFTQRLAKIAEGLGVTFRQNVHVKALKTEGGAISEVVTSEGSIRGDAYVLALGSYSPQLLRPIGIDIPVYPVKGYSITVPITDAGAAPVSTVMDETFKVAITRLGDRIRVGGTAELSGFDKSLSPARRATLEHSVTDLFPDGGDVAKASFWCGHRPMTPDGTPIIGGSKYRNLFLSTGHGTLGWTMACGSGRVIADIVSGKRPEIETADLALTRY